MSSPIEKLRAVRELRHAVAPALAPVLARVRPAWATLTSAGRAVLGLVLLTWLVGARFGWEEVLVVAQVGAVLLVLAVLFMLGRTSLDAKLVVEPARVTVGEAVTGWIAATNTARSPLLPVVLELPVGTGGIGFDVPALKPGAVFEEIFVVPTERRGVIPVGPVSSVRGDPIGLFRRTVTWTGVTEIFVHPRIVHLEPLGAGLMRDLEGQTAENVSMSDLAFHALREYAPGDDLRHVHWRSSARHATLLVRQFLDTRRSHLNVIVDCRADAYRDEADFELAVSAAGSLLVRAVLDEYDATFLSGPHAMTRGTGKSALDACSRAELRSESLVHVAAQGSRLAPDTSVVFLVTGPHTDFLTLQRAAAQFPIEVAKVGVRVDSATTASLRTAGDLPLLTLSRLEELPSLLRWRT